MAWTAPQVAMLRELVAKGLTRHAIAHEMRHVRPGVTHKAVGGAVRRHGLSCHTEAPWTDEHVAELRRLFAEGKSQGEVAKAMLAMRPDCTRNAIISARRRFCVPGLAQRGVQATKAKPPPKPKAVAKPPPKPKGDYKDRIADILPPAPPPPEDTWAPLAGTKPRALRDLEYGDCRWPLAGGLFCAAVKHVHSNSYCRVHQRMAYRPVQRRAA